MISTKDLDLHRQLIDIDRADCEESLYVYLKSAWHVFDSAPWVDGWAIDVIAEHLQAVVDGEIRRLIINVPPRHSKSALCSVAFTGWTWAQRKHTHTSGPGVSFLYASFREDLSRRDSVACRRIIESQWYQDRWGDRFKLSDDQNTKSRFTNDKGGYRLITSIESKGATGDGANCFVAGTKVDTPTGRKNIEDLRVGDAVLAFDVQRGKVVTSRVLATAHRPSNELCTLHSVSGHRLVCTQDHPIYSPGRGFVRAGEMGAGDRLLIADEAETSNFDIAEFDLRQLWQTGSEKTLRTAQSAETRKSGRILFRSLLSCAPRVQEYARHMQKMRKRSAASKTAILLGGMQTSDWKLVQKRIKNVRDLRKTIRKIGNWLSFLFASMCQQRAFATDEGGCKLQISRQWSLFQSFSANAQSDYQARQQSMHSMSLQRENGAPISSKEQFARSSHRPEYQESESRESDHALRALSQASSSWRIGHVSRVSKDSSTTHDVYDIQVEGENNFFANGILVHNCIILDDCNSAKEVESELVIASTLEWFDGTLGTRLNNQKLGAVINVQQRLGENDITGHILSKQSGDWVHLCLPMEYEPERSYVNAYGWKDPRTEPGELLWPERFGPDEVRALKTWMGDWRASGQLQQSPQPKGGGIIKREWWQLWERDAYPPMDFILGTLDTAYTLEQMNDPSGMIVWGVFSGDPIGTTVRGFDREGRLAYQDRHYSEPEAPKVMLAHAWTDRYEFYELIKKTADTCIKLKVDLLLIENKAAGISVAQELRRLYGNEKFSVQLFDPKSQDKFARLVSVQHLFQEKLVYAPDRTWAEAVITQVGQFPRSKHDEYVDLTSMGLRYLRDRGLISRAVERRAEMDSLKIYPRGQDIPLYPA